MNERIKNIVKNYFIGRFCSRATVRTVEDTPPQNVTYIPIAHSYYEIKDTNLESFIEELMDYMKEEKQEEYD